MNFVTKYAWKNIKHNKLDAWLISIALFISTAIFLFTFLLPTFIRNFQEEKMRSFYGNSDIYIMPKDAESMNDLTGLLANVSDIDRETLKKFEYISPMVIVPGDISNDSAYIVMANFNEIANFNTIEFYTNPVESLKKDEVIVSKAYADKYNLSIGSIVNLYMVGENANFKIAAIAKNRGIFSGLNTEVVLGEKSAISSFLPGWTYPTIYKPFDVAVIKVKEGVDVDEVIERLQEIFPKMLVDKTVNIDIIEKMVEKIMPLFYIGVVLVCILCAFIVYIINNIIFKTRVKEFARLRVMGATTPQLVMSMFLESFFYGIIGVASALLTGFALTKGLGLFPDMSFMSGGTLQQYLFAGAGGIAFILVCSLSQSLYFIRSSIREVLVDSQRPSASRNILNSVIFFIMIASLFCTIFFPLGQSICGIVSLIVFIATIIWLSPLLLRIALTIYKRAFRLKNFSQIHLSRSTHCYYSPMLIRVISFGAFVVILLSVFASTTATFSGRGAQPTHNIEIANVSALTRLTIDNKTGSRALTTITNMEHVEGVFGATILKTGQVAQNNLKGLNIFGYPNNIIASNYSNLIEGSMYDFNLGNSVLLGRSFKYLLGYKLGDNIEIIFDKQQNQIATFKIAGFIDSTEQDGNLIVLDIDRVNEISGVSAYNSILVLADSNYVKSVMNEVKQSFKNQRLMLTNLHSQQQKMSDLLGTPIVLVYIFISIILISVATSIFICFSIYIKQTKQIFFTYNSLGLENLHSLLTSQMIIFSVTGLVISYIIIAVFRVQFLNIINTIGLALAFSYSLLALAMISISYILVYVILALSFSNKFKKFLYKRI